MTVEKMQRHIKHIKILPTVCALEVVDTIIERISIHPHPKKWGGPKCTDSPPPMFDTLHHLTQSKLFLRGEIITLFHVGTVVVTSSTSPKPSAS